MLTCALELCGMGNHPNIIVKTQILLELADFDMLTFSSVAFLDLRTIARSELNTAI